MVFVTVNICFRCLYYYIHDHVCIYVDNIALLSTEIIQTFFGVFWKPSSRMKITVVIFTSLYTVLHSGNRIDLIRKSQNAPVSYPTKLHSEQKCAHFCSEWSIVGYGTWAFVDLWYWSKRVRYICGTWALYVKVIVLYTGSVPII